MARVVPLDTSVYSSFTQWRKGRKMITRRKFTRTLLTGIASAVMVGSLALTGCGSSSSTAATSAASATTSSSAKAVQLQIFAANSLQKALPEVQALYTEKNPNVTFADSQFEASGTLVEKLTSGGTADVLITASTKTMDNAASGGTVDESTRADMFSNDLVICTKSGSTLQISSISDLATDKVSSFAIGDPNTVPAGKYALQALKSAGLVTYDEASDGTVSNVVWAASVASKVNAGADKVGTVASYVKQGTVDCGFVYTSDIYRYDGIGVAFTTPADSHKAIKYPGAVCTSSSNPEVAADFLNFCLTDPDALKIFSEYGFELV